jgi:hypothetical protein
LRRRPGDDLALQIEPPSVAGTFDGSSTIVPPNDASQVWADCGEGQEVAVLSNHEGRVPTQPPDDADTFGDAIWPDGIAVRVFQRG